MTRWTVGVAPLVLVGLTLLLADAVQLESEQEELTCSDRRTQLATKVVHCFVQAQTKLAPGATSDVYQGGNRTVDGETLQGCFSQSGQGLKVITALTIHKTRAFVEPLLDQFASESGLELAITYKVQQAIYSELKFSVQQAVSGVYNVFFSSSDVMGELDKSGLYKDLTPFIENDDGVYGTYRTTWNEIHPFFREALAVSGSRILTVPYLAFMPYMYWRTDVFRRFNLTVPQTWEEIIEVARFLNRTEWDPRVRNKIPICFPKPLIREMGQPNEGAYLLTSILGSMTQYQGRVQGLIFDPASMTPLVNNTAMARALELYAQLADLMPDDTPDRKSFNSDSQTIVVDGYCALAFRWTGTMLLNDWYRVPGVANPPKAFPHRRFRCPPETAWE